MATTEKPSNIVTAASLVESSKAHEFIQLLGVLANKVAMERASSTVDTSEKANLIRYANNAMSNAMNFALSAINDQKVAEEIAALGYNSDVSKYNATRDFVSQVIIY